MLERNMPKCVSIRTKLDSLQQVEEKLATASKHQKLVLQFKSLGVDFDKLKRILEKVSRYLTHRYEKEYFM